MESTLKFNYDYSQCMAMKLFMSEPDKNKPGKSKVALTFSDAYEYIKKIDNMTPGITKIYYLVGWQYLGHDDKYPDFFEVNKALKRPEDETAFDSFKWLCEESKKYNSIVSVHINFNDVYDNAPSFNEFVKNNALIRKRNGKIHAIEKYNGRKCYKTCHKNYWESGLFKKTFDRFVDTFPFIAEAGTIHVDNFQCYKNYAPYVSIKQMQDARRSMIKYVHDKGIDITSEFTYKESDSLPNRPIFGLPRDHFSKYPMDTVGLIPLSWWCYRMTRKELVETPPDVYCGGVYREKRFNQYLYGNMHAEEIIKKDNPNWAKDFLYQFATYQIPFHFLSTKRRLSIEGYGSNEHCTFSDNVISYRKHSKITENGRTLKENDELLIPYVHLKNTYFAYSKIGRKIDGAVNVQSGKAKIYEITENGIEKIHETEITNGKITFDINKNQALLIECFN